MSRKVKITSDTKVSLAREEQEESVLSEAGAAKRPVTERVVLIPVIRLVARCGSCIRCIRMTRSKTGYRKAVSQQASVVLSVSSRS